MFYSKDQRQHKNRTCLRSAPHSRQLRHRSHHPERQNEQRIRKAERRQSAAKRMQYPQINKRNQDPVQRRIQRQQEEIIPGANCLQPLAESFDQHNYLLAPSGTPPRIPQEVCEQTRAMKPEIDQHRDNHSEPIQQRPPYRARENQQMRSALIHQSTLLEESQGNAGQYRRRGDIRNPFEKENAKHSSHRQRILLGNQHWTNRFPRAAQQTKTAKSHQFSLS